MGTLRRRGTRAQDLTCPYVPLIRIQLELRGSDDMKWHVSRDMNPRVNKSWTHWYIWVCVCAYTINPNIQINLEPFHHSHKKTQPIHLHKTTKLNTISWTKGFTCCFEIQFNAQCRRSVPSTTRPLWKKAAKMGHSESTYTHMTARIYIKPIWS